MLAGMPSAPDLLWGLVLGVTGAALTLASSRLFPADWKVPRAAQVRLAATMFAFLLVSTLVVGREVTTLGSVLGFTLGGLMVMKRARRARLVVAALRDVLAATPETRERAFEHVRTLLGPPPARAREHQAWVQTVLYVAAHLQRVEMAHEALSLADALDRSRLAAPTLGVRAQLVAACAVTLGDRARARKELASVPREKVSPLYQRALGAMDLLLDALEDTPADDLEDRCRKALSGEVDASVKHLARAALAHALAGSGRREEARAELRALRDEAARDAQALGTPTSILARVVRHRGPASPLAEAVLASEGTPYRST